MWQFKFGGSAQSEFIDGINDPASVADLFASKFERACGHNSVDRSYTLFREFLNEYDGYTGDADYPCHG